MKGRRITLTVEVNLDPVPGAFHTAEDMTERLQAMLTHAFPWYDPKVTLTEESV